MDLCCTQSIHIDLIVFFFKKIARHCPEERRDGAPRGGGGGGSKIWLNCTRAGCTDHYIPGYGGGYGRGGGGGGTLRHFSCWFVVLIAAFCRLS